MTEIQELDKKLENIMGMLRHIHNNVENLQNKQDRTDNRICNFENVLENALRLDFEFDKQLVDLVLNPEIDYSSEDSAYSPIDDVDAEDWNKHVNNENRLATSS